MNPFSFSAKRLCVCSIHFLWWPNFFSYQPCSPVFVPGRDMTEVMINSTPMEDMRLSPSKDRLSFQVGHTDAHSDAPQPSQFPARTFLCGMGILHRSSSVLLLSIGLTSAWTGGTQSLHVVIREQRLHLLQGGGNVKEEFKFDNGFFLRYLYSFYFLLKLQEPWLSYFRWRTGWSCLPSWGQQIYFLMKV